MSESGSGPYRRDDHPARYFCTVCWQAAASASGMCPRDGAVMQPVDGDLTLVEELRRRAREKKDRPGQRMVKLNMLLSLGVAILLHAALLIGGVYDLKGHGKGPWLSDGSLLFLYVFVTALLLFSVNVYLLPALGIFKGPAGAEQFDPDNASVDQMADWLGIKVDASQR